MRTIHTVSSRFPRNTVRGLIMAMVICLLIQIPGFAFKPKVHLYLGWKLLQDLPPDRDAIQLPGFANSNLWFAADPELCTAVRKWPEYFLAGTVGPDAFPDIVFGQAVVHADLRCDYDRCFDCSCELGPESRTWTDDWLRHLWERAHSLRSDSDDRGQALAFVLGYLSHAAGDMWGHTFANEYAGGSWPVDYFSSGSVNNIARHLITEGVVGNHIQDIKPLVDSVGGLKVPHKFLYSCFIADGWAFAHRGKSLISMMLTLRDKLESYQSDELQPFTDDERDKIAALLVAMNSAEPIIATAATSEIMPYAMKALLRAYITCWLGHIDKGLNAWLDVSENIAYDFFVREDDEHLDAVKKELTDFKDTYLNNMLGLAPYDMVMGCIAEGLNVNEDLIKAIVNPADFLADKAKEIFRTCEEWVNRAKEEIQRDFMNWVFRKAFGYSFDDFKDYWTNAETLAPTPTFLGPDTTNEILALLHLDSRGLLSDEQCAVIHNTNVLNHMLLLNVENLNALMFRFNVGPIYTEDTYPNVMLGYIKSIDGNHQWRKNAPPTVAEPNRSFSKGMPLWTDWKGRNNFFMNVFKDWTSIRTTMVFKPDDPYDSDVGLEAVTAQFRLLTTHSHCTPSFVEIKLTNHQEQSQDYAVYVTIEDRDVIAGNPPEQHGVPMTYPCPPCDKNAAPEPLGGPAVRIDFSPVYYEPGGDEYDPKIFFYKVERGTLPGAPDTCADKFHYIRLPDCFRVNGLVRAYFLREISTARPPILTNNPRIPRNPIEHLMAEITSSFASEYILDCCEDCTRPACENGQEIITYRVPVPGKPESSQTLVTIPVPCDPSCYPNLKDADGDNIYNESDLCPLMPNSQIVLPNDRSPDCGAGLLDLRRRFGGIMRDIARAELAFHDLIEHGTLRLDPVRVPLPRGAGEPVVIEGSIIAPIAQTVDDWVNQWKSGGISDAKFFRTLQLLLHGLYYQSGELGIVRATFTRGERRGVFDRQNPRCLVLNLSPRALVIAGPTEKANVAEGQAGRRVGRRSVPIVATGGKALDLAIPRVLLDARMGEQDSAFLIFIDGKKMEYKEQKTEEFRILSLKISAGAKKLEVFGNSPGPGSIGASAKPAR